MKEVHIVERKQNSKDWQIRKAPLTNQEPPRSVAEAIQHLHATHGPTKPVKRKGATNA